MRRILGKRLSNFIRNRVVDLYALLGKLPKVDRSNCISALVRVKNEEWWIEPSILSIKDLVHEYIVIDASTDRTPEIIDRLRDEYGLNMVHIMDFDEDIAAASQRGLERCTCRWILRWDGDFVMQERGVQFLKSLIDKLRKDRFYTIYFPHVILIGDLYHTPPNPLHVEHWLVTYVPGMRFVRIPGGFEYLYTPTHLAYRIEIENPLSYHINVKPKIKLLERKYRWEHYIKGVWIPLEEYIKKRILEDYGTADVNEAAEKFYQEYIKEMKLIPFDKTKYGDYPKILKEYVKKKWGITL